MKYEQEMSRALHDIQAIIMTKGVSRASMLELLKDIYELDEPAELMPTYSPAASKFLGSIYAAALSFEEDCARLPRYSLVKQGD